MLKKSIGNGIESYEEDFWTVSLNSLNQCIIRPGL